MYFQIGLISVLLGCLYAAPIDDCNTLASCDDHEITTPNTTQTFAWENNKRFFYSCTTDNELKKTRSKCLYCLNDNQMYVERCEKCEAIEMADKCEKYVASTSSPPRDRSCGILTAADTCENKANGSYHLENNNQKLYSCFLGEMSKYCEECAGNLVYSDKCQRCVIYTNKFETDDEECDLNGNDTLGAAKCDDVLCAGKMDGDFEKAGNGNNDFYSCSGGFCWEKKCAEDLVYSAACEACTHSYTSSSDNCEEIIDIKGQAYQCKVGFCNGRETGTYPDDVDPSIYYRCSKAPIFGNNFVYSCDGAQKCPDGLRYDRDEDKCLEI